MGHLPRLHTAHLQPANMVHLPARLDRAKALIVMDSTGKSRLRLFRGGAGATVGSQAQSWSCIC